MRSLLRDCELLPRGPRPEGPPLLVGSIGPRMLRITMPHVQSWNAWYWWFRNTPDELGGPMAAVDEACRDVGRDPADEVWDRDFDLHTWTAALPCSWSEAARSCSGLLCAR